MQKVSKDESPDYVLGVLQMIYKNKSDEILESKDLRDTLRQTAKNVEKRAVLQREVTQQIKALLQFIGE